MIQQFRIQEVIDFRGVPEHRILNTTSNHVVGTFRFYENAVARCAALNEAFEADKAQRLPQPGDRGTHGGFPVTVIRQYDGNMFELRFPGGVSVVDITHFEKEQQNG